MSVLDLSPEIEWKIRSYMRTPSAEIIVNFKLFLQSRESRNFAFKNVYNFLDSNRSDTRKISGPRYLGHGRFSKN